jgi:hypothetical protein
VVLNRVRLARGDLLAAAQLLALSGLGLGAELRIGRNLPRCLLGCCALCLLLPA